MATQLDIEIIDEISSAIAEAKTKKHDVSIELSGGVKRYRKAIGIMRLTGGIALFAYPLGGILFILQNTISCGEFCLFDPLGVIVIGITAAVIPSIFAYKIFSLKITPTFMLVSLIILAILGIFIFFFWGLFPLLVLIFSIISMIRWSTYKNWFYSIDTDYHKEKSHANKIKK